MSKTNASLLMRFAFIRKCRLRDLTGLFLAKDKFVTMALVIQAVDGAGSLDVASDDVARGQVCP